MEKSQIKWFDENIKIFSIDWQDSLDTFLRVPLQDELEPIKELVKNKKAQLFIIQDKGLMVTRIIKTKGYKALEILGAIGQGINSVIPAFIRFCEKYNLQLRVQSVHNGVIYKFKKLGFVQISKTDEKMTRLLYIKD